MLYVYVFIGIFRQPLAFFAVFGGKDQLDELLVIFRGPEINLCFAEERVGVFPVDQNSIKIVIFVCSRIQQRCVTSRPSRIAAYIIAGDWPCAPAIQASTSAYCE